MKDEIALVVSDIPRQVLHLFVSFLCSLIHRCTHGGMPSPQYVVNKVKIAGGR
jgi:hypothetical protein